MSITRGIDWTASIGTSTEEWFSWKDLGLDLWLSETLETMGCFGKKNIKHINGVFYAIIDHYSAELLIQAIHNQNWNISEQFSDEIATVPRNIETLDRMAQWMKECLSETDREKKSFVYWSLLD